MADQLWVTVVFLLGMAGTWYRLDLAGAWWLLRRGVEPPLVGPDGVAFRYPAGVAYLGWAFLGVGAVFTGSLALLLPVETVRDGVALAVVVAFFAAPGLCALAAHRRGWVRLTATGFDVQGMVASEPARVRWDEVERVSFGRYPVALVFCTTDGQTVRVSGFFGGAGHLAEAVSIGLPDRGGPLAATTLLVYRQDLGL